MPVYPWFGEIGGGQCFFKRVESSVKIYLSLIFSLPKKTEIDQQENTAPSILKKYSLWGRKEYVCTSQDDFSVLMFKIEEKSNVPVCVNA